MNTGVAEKFLYVQDNPPEFCGSYEQALNEMKNGRKSSHWIWYIFPQIQGLGHSEMNRRYSLYGRSDVLEYWANPTLQARMREILNVILESKVGIMNLLLLVVGCAWVWMLALNPCANNVSKGLRIAIWCSIGLILLLLLLQLISGISYIVVGHIRFFHSHAIGHLLRYLIPAVRLCIYSVGLTRHY